RPAGDDPARGSAQVRPDSRVRGPPAGRRHAARSRRAGAGAHPERAEERNHQAVPEVLRPREGAPEVHRRCRRRHRQGTAPAAHRRTRPAPHPGRGHARDHVRAAVHPGPPGVRHHPRGHPEPRAPGARVRSQRTKRLSGTLFVVATPIGNLEDVTARALRVLREVDLIACEDTRRTRALLSHFDIHTPTTSYFEHNKLTRGPRILRQLAEGKSIALVTDAGTPGISDPGFLLV